MWKTCVKPSNPVYKFAIFAGYQSIFDMGLWGYFLKYEAAIYAPIKANIATRMFSMYVSY
jgi:hypothetical protein